MDETDIEHKNLLEGEYERGVEINGIVSGGYEENKGETQKGNEMDPGRSFIMKEQEFMEEERQGRIFEVCDSITNVILYLFLVK